jgi:hypothetical protein
LILPVIPNYNVLLVYLANGGFEQAKKALTRYVFR